MKKLLKLIPIVLLIGLAFSACAKPPAAPGGAEVKTPTLKPATPARGDVSTVEWGKIVESAKKEGELLIYSSMPADTIRKLGGVFRDKYAVKVDVVSARGPELLQKMQSERQAGLYLVDVIMAGGTNLVVSMKPQGFLDPMEPVLILPEVTNPQSWRIGNIPYYDKERYGIGMIASFNRYILRNTDLVKEGELTSYKDLLKPRWKSKMVINDPTVTGAGNSFFTGLAVGVWDLEETKRFMQGLVNQEPVITRDLRQQAEWVSKGKYELGIAPTPEQVAPFLKMGAPIAQVKVIEGAKMGAMAGGLGVANKRPHPNATVLFVNWLLSNEGHATFIKELGLPGARADAPSEGIPPMFFPDPGEKFFLETEEVLKMEVELQKVARDIFAPLLK